MAMRVTGMMSGMDTESIIQQLVAARQTKVDNLKKQQTKHEWKQDAWKELNSKIYKLYSGTLANMQYTTAFAKKTTTVSNSNLVSVITDGNAMDSVQSLTISNLAKAGYLTGGSIKGTDGKILSGSSKLVERLGIEAGSKFEIETKDKKTEITIDENTTVDGLVNQLKAAGVNANFDANQQRFYIGATELGEDADFTMIASNGKGTTALDKLGILVYDDNTMKAYKEYADMFADPTGVGKNALIDARVEARRAGYVSERDALKKQNEELNKTLQNIQDAYNQNPDRLTVLSDPVERQARRTYLEQKIEDMTAEGVTLDDTQKKELEEYKTELSYVKAYDETSKSIDDNNARISEINEYVNEDGTVNTDPVEKDGVVIYPSGKLTGEVTAEVEAKLQEASDIYNAYEASKVDGVPTMKGSAGANKQVGENSLITLNGVDYKSSTNTVKVNGLTITCNGTTAKGEEITLTTKNDTSGIYDMIKSFIKEYSALINEMDKLYNAESAKGYEPLTDEEKEAMSESDVTKWEEKIKGSILRRDSTISSVAGAMKEIMASGFEVNGKKMFLYDFGIETLGYFNAADNEKNAYHIHGDEDDEAVRNETNKLMAMINSDPDAVVGFFTQLSQKLYGKMFDMMGTTEFSSIYKVYDDKKMKEEYDEYTKKIAQEEKKLQDYEDKWYKKFAAMETAMAKMQSNASAVTSLLGGS